MRVVAGITGIWALGRIYKQCFISNAKRMTGAPSLNFNMYIYVCICASCIITIYNLFRHSLAMKVWAFMFIYLINNVLFIFYSLADFWCVKLELKMLFSILFILEILAVMYLILLNVNINTNFSKAKSQHMEQRDWQLRVARRYNVDINNRF